MKKSRQKLPFREKCEVFLLFQDNEVVAQDRGHYLMFPGGGVDVGENRQKAAVRETLEETGVRIKGLPMFLVTVDFVWHPEWADNDKRRERYAKYQGERVHIYVGKADYIGKPTSTEGDGWKGAKTMSLKKCLKLMIDYGEKDHPNTYAYRVAQIAAINSLQLLKS